MIVYDLSCDRDHRFEGWFGSSVDFADQLANGLVQCPHCGSPEVVKAPMAPAVPRKGNQLPTMPEPDRKPLASGPMPPEVTEALKKLAEAQADALSQSKWVGNAFAEKSRAMHYGEQESETIHGQATAEEARELFEEGIAVSPLPFPVAPPDEVN
ncbi:MAG TPA: DUF1178 family protein [Croceibacterium sp.]|nr:DUF1178 family protein [Croceibacterium sp.]